MAQLDSYVNIPILIAAALAGVLLLLLLISSIRNTAKVSFVIYPVMGIFIAGLIYTLNSRRLFPLIAIFILMEAFLIAYSFVLAVSNPQKKAEKLRKREQEDYENSEVGKRNKLLLEATAKKYQGIIETNTLINKKAASFFNTEDTLTGYLDYLNKMLSEKLNADGCTILVKDEFDNVLAVKSVSGSFPPPYKLPEDLPHKQIRVETNFKYAQFQLEGNTFGDIFSAGEAINITEPQKDKRIFQNGPEEFLKCGPYIFLPVKQEGMGLMLICLARKPGRQPFSSTEFENAKILADGISAALYPVNSFLSYAEHAEMTKEGDIATKFQKTMLPEKLPVINKLSIGKYTQTAENVCGDYYDVIPSRKDRIMFVMADVAGKGMNSLLIMIMIRAMLRLVANTNQSMATLLEWVNKAICSEKNNMDHFASVALINYDSTTDNAEIATCGINPVLHYSAADKKVTKISIDTEPIGVEKDTVYRNINVSLSAGDILISCTDGLIECLNDAGSQYSLATLSKVIEGNSSRSGKDIANKVKDSVRAFCGETQQYDDQSILVVKIQG